ncbi:MAG: nitroreductase family protein [Bdellovibrionales bacterium]|nr:nitroreductase family protein [Bdellovibrionales bacterium]
MLRHLKQVIRRILKFFFSDRTSLAIQLARDYLYDCRRFYRGSALVRLDTRQRIEGWIIQDYHRIEKGLIALEPRIFGEYFRDRLVRNVEDFVEQYGITPQVAAAIKNLRLYVEFHQKLGAELSEEFNARVQSLQAHCNGTKENGVLAGYKEIRRSEISASQKVDYTSFIRSRTSVREYLREPVELSTLKKAISNALYYPSVCNRQHCRVRLFTNKQQIDQILALQNGNWTFRSEVFTLLVVTSDLSYFCSVGEKNQGYVDGGIFAMNTVLSLHAEGLGTCMLNWSRDRGSDLQLKRLLRLPDEEIVIMMIAVGYMKEQFRAAVSAKRQLDEVLIVDPGL